MELFFGHVESSSGQSGLVVVDFQSRCVEMLRDQGGPTKAKIKPVHFLLRVRTWPILYRCVKVSFLMRPLNREKERLEGQMGQKSTAYPW